MTAKKPQNPPNYDPEPGLTSKHKPEAPPPPPRKVHRPDNFSWDSLIGRELVFMQGDIRQLIEINKSLIQRVEILEKNNE